MPRDGTPDLVFCSKKKIIFVHGCFWHLHLCLRGQFTPVTNAEFWRAKREGNVRRDRRNRKVLSKAGWTTLTIWECQIKDGRKVRERIKAFLA